MNVPVGGWPERTARVALAVLATLFCTGPVPGDIGGCGQPVRDLDPDIFFSAKQSIECEKCEACGLLNAACLSACESREVPREFPRGCFPLVHDGEVCLRVLLHATCEQMTEYTRDDGPRAPTECNFCPLRGR